MPYAIEIAESYLPWKDTCKTSLNVRVTLLVVALLSLSSIPILWHQVGMSQGVLAGCMSTVTLTLPLNFQIDERVELISEDDQSETVDRMQLISKDNQSECNGSFDQGDYEAYFQYFPEIEGVIFQPKTDFTYLTGGVCTAKVIDYLDGWFYENPLGLEACELRSFQAAMNSYTVVNEMCDVELSKVASWLALSDYEVEEVGDTYEIEELPPIKTNGRYFVRQWYPTTHGHSFALEKTDAGCLLYDPNYGEFQATSHAQLIKHFKEVEQTFSIPYIRLYSIAPSDVD